MSDGGGLFKVLVRFVRAGGGPLEEAAWRVEVRDRDPLVDGTLGEADLDASGQAEVLFSVRDVSSLDTPGERKPDLYFVLYRDGEKVLTTDVTPNVDFEAPDPVTGLESTHLTRSFGPYEV